MALRPAGRLGALILVAACGGGDAPGGPVGVELAPSGGASPVVRITGLPERATRRALDRGTGLLRVVAGEALDSTAPALAGDWRREGLTLEFRPRFPPAAGLPLWVRIDTAALSGRAGPLLLSRLDPPAHADTGASATVVVHPARDSLPENMLRWYLDFSRPMHRGQALAHLALLDDRGREVRGAFLDVSDELWNPDGTRLTVLFDPGRVKQGVRTNLESGRPLVAGRRYTLRIDAAWPDRRGRPLAATVEKRFLATPADYRGPDPAAWSLRAPAIGTVAPVELDFGEALDHALAARLLAVVDERGSPVEGRVIVDRADTRWRFTPSAPWLAARYAIRVSAELEDLAGNRPGRRFDTDLADSGTPTANGPLTRWFFPTAADARLVTAPGTAGAGGPRRSGYPGSLPTPVR